MREARRVVIELPITYVPIPRCVQDFFLRVRVPCACTPAHRCQIKSSWLIISELYAVERYNTITLRIAWVDLASHSTILAPIISAAVLAHMVIT